MIFVTGGAGFIGSNFVLDWFAHQSEALLNFDKLTYAGNLQNLVSLAGREDYQFVQGDIADANLLTELFKQHQPRAIIHFAAESHVDRSIHDPAAFIQTNVLGTQVLLQTALHYYRGLNAQDQANFRFVHISTDEVYGSLSASDPAFSETTAFAPNSPYAASKAASDHLVRAYFHTYGLPVLTTNCSNNYGPYHFPEKLIPLMIVNALNGKDLPVYGDGQQIRDWLYVKDHCSAIRCVLERGQPGQTYNVGGNNEISNLEVVKQICASLDQCRPKASGSYAEQIRHVTDRPGHDRRYAINAEKIQRELGWQAQESFASGLRKTIDWYLANPDWLAQVQSGAYRQWINQHYQAEEKV